MHNQTAVIHKAGIGAVIRPFHILFLKNRMADITSFPHKSLVHITGIFFVVLIHNLQRLKTFLHLLCGRRPHLSGVINGEASQHLYPQTFSQSNTFPLRQADANLFLLFFSVSLLYKNANPSVDISTQKV